MVPCGMDQEGDASEGGGVEIAGSGTSGDLRRGHNPDPASWQSFCLLTLSVEMFKLSRCQE